MSQGETSGQEFYAFELIDSDRRQSLVPPEISTDSEILLVTDGVPVAFQDPKHFTAEVLEPLAFIAGIDGGLQAHQIDLEKLLRALRRYLNPSSIIHKALPEDQQKTLRELRGSKGFSRQLTSLIDWINQPAESYQYISLNEQEFVTPKDIQRDPNRFIGEVGMDVMDALLGGVISYGGPLSVEQVMKSYFMREGVMHRLRRPQQESLEKTYTWFQRLGKQRQVFMLEQALMVSNVAAFPESVAHLMGSVLLSDPFMAWYPVTEEPGSAELCNVEQTTRASKLGQLLERTTSASRLRPGTPNVHVVKEYDRGNKHRRQKRLADVLVIDHTVRKDMRAVLSDEVADEQDEHVYSPVMGELMLSLLFMQERRNMEADESAAIKDTKHYDPTEQIARKLALSLLFILRHAPELKQTLQERIALLKENRAL